MREKKERGKIGSRIVHVIEHGLGDVCRCRGSIRWIRWGKWIDDETSNGLQSRTCHKCKTTVVRRKQQ